MSRPSLVPMLAGSLLALAVAAPVLAHADVVASDPVNGAVLAEPPTTVTVTFSEAVDAGRSRFRLVGPDGAVGTGRVADDPTVLALDGLDLGPGAYEIQWTIASDDGHVERGKLRFTVSAPTAVPSPTAAPGATGEPVSPAPPASSAPPAAPESSGPASAGPAPTAAPAAPTGGSDGDVLLPIIVTMIFVAGVGAFVLRRSRRASA